MPLPPNAKKVFSGHIFDVYHWEQEMFDGTTETFEMLRRVDTVNVIATEGNQVLLAEQEQPQKPLFTSLFGGRQDPGETPLETAQRELLEESGRVSDDWEHLKTVQPYSKIDWRIHTFIARNCRAIQEQKLDAGERIRVEQVDFASFIDAVLTPGFGEKDLVELILRMKLEPGALSAFEKRLFP